MSFWSDLRSRFLGRGEPSDEPWHEEDAAPPPQDAGEIGEGAAPPEGGAAEAPTSEEPSPAALTASEGASAEPGAGAGVSESDPGASEGSVVAPLADEQTTGGPLADDQATSSTSDIAVPEQEHAAPVSGVAAIDVAARQERAAGLILDDEGLRGDLTDDEFQPLLSWALASSDQIVSASTTPDDEAALVEIGVRVAVVKDAVALAAEAIGAHVNGKEGQRRGALAALADLTGSPGGLPIFGGPTASAIVALSNALDADPAPEGAQLADLVVRALAGAPPQEHAESAEPEEGAG